MSRDGSIRDGEDPRVQTGSPSESKTAFPWEMDAADPLVALLDRYSDRRLAAPQAQLTRLRAGVVQAYVERGLRAARPMGRRLGWPRRLAVGAAVALALTGGASLAAAESGPGQPFYHLKLTVEALTLPAQGSARLEGLLHRLDARLAEARGATARGDHGAVADAVAAYEDTLSALSDTVSANGADAFVLDELDRHVALLEDMLGQVPAQAQPGLQRALEHAHRAQDAIKQRRGPSFRTPPGIERSPGVGPPTEQP